MLTILFITYLLSVVSELEKLYSVKIKNNKLVAIYQTWNSFNIKVRTFELKEGAIADTFNSKKTFDFGHIDEDFALVELDTPDDLIANKNKLWVRYEFEGLSYPATSPFMNGVGYIDLDDVSLKNDSTFKFPTRENFPVKGYTTNTITNELGSALYITGGEIYSKKDREFLTSNSIFKYNFTTKEWIDISYFVNGKLKPLFDHKSVIVDNRYLVILGGKRQINYNSKPSFYDRYQPFYEYNALYNFTIFDTFTNSWESVNIKADIFDSKIATLKFENFLATVYKDKIIVLGGFASDNQSNMFTSNGLLGILDLKSKTWVWSLILNEDGSTSHVPLSTQDLVVFNDQLIIYTDFKEGESYIPIYVYDIPSHRMKSTLRLSNSAYGENGTKYLPTYVIILIVASCTTLLLAFINLSYRKNKGDSSSKNDKTKYSGPIREVWANSDINNTVNIIRFDKNCSDTLYLNGLYQKSINLDISNTIEFDK